MENDHILSTSAHNDIIKTAPRYDSYVTVNINVCDNIMNTGNEFLNYYLELLLSAADLLNNVVSFSRL